MIPLLPLRIGTAVLAIEARSVVEVLGATPWIALPGTSVEVPGVVSWRGRVLPVVDVCTLTGLGERLGAGTASRTVIYRAGDVLVAIPVDAVQEVRAVADDAVRMASTTRVPHAPRELELDGVPAPILDLAAAVLSLSEGNA